MKDYVLDANALVRFFRDYEGAAKIGDLLTQADKGQAALRISAVNLAEVLYISARYVGLESAQQKIETLRSLIEFVPAGDEEAQAAAKLKHNYKLGLADCFAAELALRHNATLVTADPEFAKLGKQLKILALPRHTA
jgi:predicted nucleic acid-binding protein